MVSVVTHLFVASRFVSNIHGIPNPIGVVGQFPFWKCSICLNALNTIDNTKHFSFQHHHEMLRVWVWHGNSRSLNHCADIITISIVVAFAKWGLAISFLFNDLCCVTMNLYMFSCTLAIVTTHTHIILFGYMMNEGASEMKHKSVPKWIGFAKDQAQKRVKERKRSTDRIQNIKRLVQWQQNVNCRERWSVVCFPFHFDTV